MRHLSLIGSMERRPCLFGPAAVESHAGYRLPFRLVFKIDTVAAVGRRGSNPTAQGRDD